MSLPAKTIMDSNLPGSDQELPYTIAIDGPAASGKSTIGKKVADRLNYLFFDTGIMYRAVTWAALKLDIPIEDEDGISTLSENIELDIRPASVDDGRTSNILADGEDITWQIRHPDVDANVSYVSIYPRVRAALTAQQRRIGQRGRIVMVGRDIGTVVLPEAELKIYLDASAEERARRRYEEIRQRGGNTDYEAILEGVEKRDQIDSTRAISPLRPAEDAIIIDTDEHSIEAIFQQIMDLIHQWSHGNH